MPTYHVTAPTGEVYEVNGPDDSTEQDAISYVQKNHMAPLSHSAPQAAKPVNPALADARNRERSAPEFVRSVNRGFLPFGLGDQIDAGGAALETAVNNGLSHIGLGKGAGYSAGQAYDAVRQAQQEGENQFEEQHPLAAMAGEVTGGVATGKALGTLLLKIPQNASKASRIVQGVGTVLKEKPVAQFVGGMTGGMAAKTAKDMGAPAPVQLGAAIVASGLGAGGYEGIKNIAGAGQRTITQQGARETASNLLRGAAVDPDAAVSRIASLPDSVSGASPTLAEAALDPGLAGLQPPQTTNNINTGARVAQRVQENTGKRLSFLDDVTGQGDPQTLQNLAQDTAAKANAAVPAAAQRLGPAAYAEDSGTAARSALQDAHEAAKARTSAAYNAPELNEAVPVDIPGANFKAITDSARQFYGDAGGEVPTELREIIQAAAVEGNNTRALANIDRRLADYAGSARVSGRGREAAFAEGVRRQIGAVAEAGMPEAQRNALAAARQARREQADVFETGAIGRALNADKYGRSTLNASAVPQTLIPKGRAGAEAIDQLVTATSPQHAEQVAREEMRRLTTNVTDSKAFERIASDFEPVLNRFPMVADDLNGARQVAAMAEAFPKTSLGRFSDPGKDPVQVVESILQAKDGNRAFTSLVTATKGNPDAADGLRRAVANYVTNSAKTSAFDAAGNQIASNSKMLGSLTKVIEASEQAGLFTSQQAMALKQLKTEIQGTQFAHTANRTAGSDTSRNVAQRFAKAGEAASGGLRSVRLLKAVMGVMSNEKEVSALVERAILDPKFAAELIKPVPPNRVKDAVDSVKAAVFGGATASLGISTAPKPPESDGLSDLVGTVDRAEYRIKGGKRQKYNPATDSYDDIGDAR